MPPIRKIDQDRPDRGANLAPAACLAPDQALQKCGWRVPEWASAVGIARSSVYELIGAKTIDSVRFGGAGIITTRPEDFLASLREVA